MPACASSATARRSCEDLVGVTTGLAWTEVGGEMLTIEAVTVPGKGKITTTGKLGDVMKESVAGGRELRQVARGRASASSRRCSRRDIHVHVPEGATPKDGPSAGRRDGRRRSSRC